MSSYPEARGWDWGRVRAEKMERNRRDNDGACEARYDGCLGVAEEVHHVVARVDGGGDNDGLLALCSACHYRLTTELIQRRAKERRAAKAARKRKNHPGRKDRYDSE